MSVSFRKVFWIKWGFFQCFQRRACFRGPPYVVLNHFLSLQLGLYTNLCLIQNTDTITHSSYANFGPQCTISARAHTRARPSAFLVSTTAECSARDIPSRTLPLSATRVTWCHRANPKWLPVKHVVHYGGRVETLDYALRSPLIQEVRSELGFGQYK